MQCIGIEECPERMVEVLLDLAGAFDVLHEVDAVRLERPMDAFRHVEWARLVMKRIEGRDEVEGGRRGGLVEGAQIALDELDIWGDGSRGRA